MKWKLLVFLFIIFVFGVLLLVPQKPDEVLLKDSVVSSDKASVEISCIDELDKLRTKRAISFLDYFTEGVYDSQMAELNEESDDSAKRFYSRYQEAREKGVRYGGKYAVAEWAMTGWGHFLGVMDAETGVVTKLPMPARFGFEYYPDSLLLVADPVSMTDKYAEENGEAVCWYFSEPGLYPKPRYYLLKDGEFVEINLDFDEDVDVQEV